ncbi:ATP-dependent DNA helicase PIF1-like [Neltuma alba]|uniref:ATP-dependent DNA helicase PIF1-like n=1 Tax=Neltuma alba TaxID=207710 RepID=UPI0010A42772|nr:ATP-dependent DNA helicase PIF1-like [Prosopis alba]
MSRLPNHTLKLKVGAPVMLIRNIDKSNGLCNGTRLIVIKLEKHVIICQMLSDTIINQTVMIPGMTITPSDSRYPFTLCRRQFPLILSFAMTINKSQGQSLHSVGLFLPHPVFTHGQLYVAVSRVLRKSGLKILILDTDGKASNRTNNVVYKEVFHNIYV